VHDRQRVELIIVAIIKPGADNIIEPQACAPRKCYGVDHELGDGPLAHRAWLIVQNVDPTVADLQDVNVTGERRGTRQWYVEAKLVLQVSKGPKASYRVSARVRASFP
jgi:hypothetical protein